MSLLIKGVAKLSQLEIDADKDWRGKGITNIKEVASAMGHGDMILRSGSTPILIKLPTEYGVGYHFIHAKSLGGGVFEPEWMDIQDIVSYLTGALNKMAAPPTLTIPIPNISKEALASSSPPGRTAQSTLSVPEPVIGLEALSAPGGGVTSVQILDIPAPSISEELATRHPVDGAVADDGGVRTDETTEANSAMVNDMTLLPAIPAVNDAYYFGYSTLWDWLRLNIGTAGAGTWIIVWEYWNGTAWTGLPDISDGASHFGNAGMNEVTFTRPGDWATTDVGSILGLYWIRARVSAYTSITTQPLGTQAWIWVKH